MIDRCETFKPNIGLFLHSIHLNNVKQIDQDE